ncbi:hypothetical protein CK489_13355 [Bradyrhizobium sp. UFLA03-84]|uniref:hypothetical protein n=1 Tax=Bradyrhizobium sp. UFLA03-84 TaxID=418599 RepID=UPI000BADFF4B|nr:hypothetical protein [Bradyrhizobium sp. UFLA03-84]PAY08655.1 hypothetical protein CK489_13355 [Bradyrhizobium sp. UFLA03-84]
MLQFPVLEPEPKDKPTGYFLANAGEGRCLAQLLRATRKEIKKDEQAAFFHPNSGCFFATTWHDGLSTPRVRQH